ncbi:ribosomal protein L1-like protein [Chytridium lagenaria]|nr:ribosomal protein L1-like protein [Chytridium lagenaria]
MFALIRQTVHGKLTICKTGLFAPCAAVRFYDRKLFKKEKRRMMALQNQEDVTFKDAMSVFRLYCLGEDRELSAHIICEKQDEGTKPVKGDIRLPKPMTGGTIQSTILVFAKGPMADEAKRLGAHIVGGEELIAQVAAGQITFDRCLATKEMFPQVVKIAKVLGPKGLMPSPARGTVSDDIAQMIANLNATQAFEIDTDSAISLEIARTSWTDENIQENLRAFVKAIVGAKPAKTDASKLVESINISAPFAPGLRLPMKPFRDLLQ